MKSGYIFLQSIGHHIGSYSKKMTNKTCLSTEEVVLVDEDAVSQLMCELPADRPRCFSLIAAFTRPRKAIEIYYR